MKKTYSTPLVTASDVVSETLGVLPTTSSTVEFARTSIKQGLGFGL